MNNEAAARRDPRVVVRRFTFVLPWVLLAGVRAVADSAAPVMEAKRISPETVILLESVELSLFDAAPLAVGGVRSDSPGAAAIKSISSPPRPLPPACAPRFRQSAAHVTPWLTNYTAPPRIPRVWH
jgi:hypothetical protein